MYKGLWKSGLFVKIWPISLLLDPYSHSQNGSVFCIKESQINADPDPQHQKKAIVILILSVLETLFRSHKELAKFFGRSYRKVPPGVYNNALTLSVGLERLT